MSGKYNRLKQAAASLAVGAAVMISGAAKADDAPREALPVIDISPSSGAVVLNTVREVGSAAAGVVSGLADAAADAVGTVILGAQNGAETVVNGIHAAKTSAALRKGFEP